jgi:hypothetical protein
VVFVFCIFSLSSLSVDYPLLHPNDTAEGILENPHPNKDKGNIGIMLSLPYYYRHYFTTANLMQCLKLYGKYQQTQATKHA